MDAAPGTYVFLLHNKTPIAVRVGRLREIRFEPGYYLYVGSAFGPGGVRARVLRHCRRQKSLHWHIDYLSAATTPLGAWYCHAATPLEHDWAGLLQAMDGLLPILGFGCSDCQCVSHLFHTAVQPDLAQFPSLCSTPLRTLSYLSCPAQETNVKSELSPLLRRESWG